MDNRLYGGGGRQGGQQERLFALAGLQGVVDSALGHEAKSG